MREQCSLNSTAARVAGQLLLVACAQPLLPTMICGPYTALVFLEDRESQVGNDVLCSVACRHWPFCWCVCAADDDSAQQIDAYSNCF